MPGNGHVRFGRRAAETDQSKDRHRAAARPHTEHPTREGKVYCAVVLDACTRRVAGWSSTARRPPRWSPAPWTWPSATGPHSRAL